MWGAQPAPARGGTGGERRPTRLIGEAAPRPEFWPLDEVLPAAMQGLWPLIVVLRAAFEVEGLLLEELPVVAEGYKAPGVRSLDEQPAAAEEDLGIELEQPAAEEEDPDIELAVL